jgi:catechol 2,3-dioxygenase-like lactoylglutathione lyase family enzyme
MPIVPDMLGIVVSDLPRSIAFYRLLGLAFPAPEEGSPYVEVKSPNGYRISLNAESMAKSLDPTWEPPRGQRMELAFLCESPAEVDRAYAAVVAAGHAGHKEPWDAFWGQRYAVVRDPDGTHVSLFAPLASAQPG